MQSCESNTKNDNSQPEHPFSQKGSFVEDDSELLHDLKKVIQRNQMRGYAFCYDEFNQNEKQFQKYQTCLVHSDWTWTGCFSSFREGDSIISR